MLAVALLVIGTAAASPEPPPLSDGLGAEPAALTAQARPRPPGPRREKPSQDLLQHRQRLLKAHRGLKVATSVSFAVTGTLGVIASLNQPTLLGDGRCITGDPIFGSYGCNEFSIVHGTTGVVTTALYVATTAVGWSVPDVEGAPGTHPFRHGGLHRVLTWVHVVGMIVQPVLGIVNAYPGIVGAEPNVTSDFSRTLRSVHIGTGLVAAASYWGTLALEW